MNNELLYDSVLMGRYLRAVGYEVGYNLTVTQTMKLLYMIEGLYLAAKGKKLVNEYVQMWPFGPVYPIAREKINYEKRENINDTVFSIINNDRYVSELILINLNEFAKYSAGKLVAWSTLSGSPWDLTRIQSSENWGCVIEEKLIKKYFEKNSCKYNDK